MDDFSQTTHLLIHLVAVVVVLCHIRSQAQRIGEPWKYLILPTVFLWWLIYPLWLFVWPGMLRPSRIGRNPEEYLSITWAKRRQRKRGNLPSADEAPPVR